MALALNNLKRVDMPLNKETKPTNQILEIEISLKKKKKKTPKISWIPTDAQIADALTKKGGSLFQNSCIYIRTDGILSVMWKIKTSALMVILL